MNRAMRVRVSGPLAPYAEGFRTVLAERGYTPVRGRPAAADGAPEPVVGRAWAGRAGLDAR